MGIAFLGVDGKRIGPGLRKDIEDLQYQAASNSLPLQLWQDSQAGKVGCIKGGGAHLISDNFPSEESNRMPGTQVVDLFEAGKV